MGRGTAAVRAAGEEKPTFSPLLPPAVLAAIEQAAAHLATALAAANRATYLRQLRTIAHEAGTMLPTTIPDSVMDGINARAQVSATSIATTQAKKMLALLASGVSLTVAQATFRTWQQQQRELVARYEATMTAHVALRDWATANGVQGTEHIEPFDAVCDLCTDAVNQGAQPIGTFPSFPIHFNCRHYLVVDWMVTP